MRIFPRLLFLLLVMGLAVQAFLMAGAATRMLREVLVGWEVVVEMKADRSGTAKLYWDVGRGFNEGDSATLKVRGGPSWQRLRFPVPKEPLGAVRFDPLRTQGEVMIRRVALLAGSGRVLAEIDPGSIRAGHQIAVLERGDFGLRVVAAEGANDPYLRLGPLGPGEGVAAPGFPWVGVVSLVLLSGVLYLLRGHCPGFALRTDGLRAAVCGWIDRIGLFDRPDPRTLAAGVLLVGLLQVWLLFPLHQAIDLPLWDEASTMSRGAAFLAGSGLGHPPDSPMALLFYSGLVGIFGPAGSIFAAHYLVKTGLAGVVFLFAARTSGSPLAGFALAMVWVLSEFQLNFPILTYQAALFWFLLALLTLKRRPWVALGCVLLAALTRLEYQFAVVVIAFLAAWPLVRRRQPWRFPSWRDGLAALAVWVPAVFVLVHLDGWTGGTNRGWHAVQQHYAWHLQVEGDFPGHHPFLEYPLVTDRDFPGAESLGQAMQVNPKALIDHVGWNLGRAPGEFLSLFVPFAEGGPGKWRVWLVGLLPGLAGLVVAFRLPRRAGGLLVERFRRHGSSIIAVASGLLVIVPGLVVFAKAAYLLPLVPLGLCLPGSLVKIGRDGGAKRLVTLLAGSAAVIMGLTVLSVPRPFVAGARPRPVVETLLVLEEALPADRPAVLLGVSAGSYAGYLGSNRVRAVEPLATFRGGSIDPAAVRFDRLLARHNPDLILIDSSWRLSTYFDREGFAELPDEEWIEESVPGGVLFRRR